MKIRLDQHITCWTTDDYGNRILYVNGYPIRATRPVDSRKVKRDTPPKVRVRGTETRWDLP